MRDVLMTVATYLVVLAAGDVPCVLLDVASPFRTSWLCLRWLCGSGVVAVVMMAMHFLGVAFSWPIVCGVIVLAWLVVRIACRRRAAPRVRMTWDWSDGLLLPMTLLALVHGLAEPIYTTDPMNIYGQNARVFEVQKSLAPDALKALVDPGHIDYPPLVALDEALLFCAAPGVRERAVKPMFALFMLGFLGLARNVIRQRVRGVFGVLLIAALTFTPELRHYGARGFADLPLAAFLMAFAVVLMCGAGRQRVGEAALAGALLGFAALTKNEGFAFAVLAVPVLAVIALVKRWRVAFLAALLVPAMLLAFSWYAFRRAHGIETDLFQSLDASAAFANLSRLPRILLEFVRVPLRVNIHQRLMWGTFWFGWASVVVLAVVSRAGNRRHLGFWIGVWLAHFLLYVAIYVITPRNLEWHLVTSVQRLVLHLLPWTVLVWVAALEPGPDDGARAHRV